MINRASFLTFSLGLSLTISFSQAQSIPITEAHINSLRQKAEQGNADTQSFLGDLYHDGLGVPKDHTEAAKWYRKAAEQGNADAQGSLGIAYLQGNGILQDYTEATKWFRKGAEQGNAAAQFMLGDLYTDGAGVPQDNLLAHMWLNLAASKSKGEYRERAVKLRDKVAKEMTREQRAEAQRLAREWAEKHRKQIPPKRRTL